MNTPTRFELKSFMLISQTYAVLHVTCGLRRERIGFRIRDMKPTKDGLILFGVNKRGKVQARACLSQLKGKSYIEYP